MLLECINLDTAATKEELLEVIKKQIERAENLNVASINTLTPALEFVFLS